MSMSPDPSSRERASDRLVGELSSFLAGHRTAEQLREAVEAVPLEELPPGERDAVQELHEELERRRSRVQLEVAVRETMEALALGE
jgi:aryl-alcohol dehydrogenase-like predicted oxidoreductase